MNHSAVAMSAQFPWFPLLIITNFFAIQNVYAACILVITRPGSRFRTAGAVGLGIICLHMNYFILYSLHLVPLKLFLGPFLVSQTVHSLCLLCFVGPTPSIRCRTADLNVLRQLEAASMLMANLRGIKTPWQIRRIPPWAPFHRQPGGIGRMHFCAREILVAAWLICLGEAVISHYAQYSDSQRDYLWGAGAEWRFLDATPRQRIARLEGIICILGYSKAFLDAPYRIMSVLHVGLRLSNPDDWPPLFGRLGDVYSIRRFWG
jgi:hypothetical protein